MKLTRTLRALKQVAVMADEPQEANDALLVSNISLLLGVLKREIVSVPQEELEPALLLELAKLYQSVGDESRCLAAFRRAATFLDQNRGYYADLGYCHNRLCRDSLSEVFRREVIQIVQQLLNQCPFSEDLRKVIENT